MREIRGESQEELVKKGQLRHAYDKAHPEAAQAAKAEAGACRAPLFRFALVVRADLSLLRCFLGGIVDRSRCVAAASPTLELPPVPSNLASMKPHGMLHYWLKRWLKHSNTRSCHSIFGAHGIRNVLIRTCVT